MNPRVVVGGQPSEEELVAILAAIEVGWPSPVAGVPRPVPTGSGWRFSGRWWARSVMNRGSRAWVGPPR